MKLTLNEEQRFLAETARQFATANSPIERVRRLRDSGDEIGFSRDLWKKMADLGWVGIQIPEAYGGQGLDFFDLCLVIEQLGRQLMPEPVLSTLLLGAQTLLLGGTEPQKRDWLPRIAAGQAIVTVAHQEPGSRYDVHRVDTTATRDGAGFRLSGVKHQVLDGHIADCIVVPARSESGELSLFLLNPAAGGVKCVRQNRVDGRNAALLRLEAVRVGDADLVGEPGRGGELLEGVVDRATIGLCAEMIGAAAQAFEDTLAYLKEREQFGTKIGAFQALQHRAARMFIEISLTRSVVLAAARSVDDSHKEVAGPASMAKARTSECFRLVADEAVQMHGGIGMTDEFHIGFYMKRALAADLTFGDASWHRDRWARLAGY